MATEGGMLQYNGDSPLEVIPSEQFAHGVTIRDDLNNQAKVVHVVSTRSNSNVELDTAFSSCVGEKIILKGKPGVRRYTAVEIFVVDMLVLHALFQPYASKFHNTIDTLLFGNLAFIMLLHLSITIHFVQIDYSGG